MHNRYKQCGLTRRTQIENGISDGTYRGDPAGLQLAEEVIARFAAEAAEKGCALATVPESLHLEDAP